MCAVCVCQYVRERETPTHSVLLCSGSGIGAVVSEAIALEALNLSVNNSFKDATASGFSFCSCRQRAHELIRRVPMQ